MFQFWPPACRLFMGAALCAMGVALASARAGEVSPWGSTARWIGHSPSDKIGRAGESFFQLPEIAEQFPKLLTPEKQARFDSYADTDRVAEVDHFLVAHRCQAGDCGAGMMTVILDETSRNMWLVMTETDGTAWSRCWTGTRHFSALPGVLQAAFTSE